MTEMPTWEGFMRPTLQVLSDGQTRSLREIFGLAAAEAGLTHEQALEVLASGQLAHENRVTWALSRLANVGALVRPSRGHYVIAEGGTNFWRDSLKDSLSEM